MEISIRSREIEHSANLIDEVQQKIGFAVDRHRSRISRISVYLADINGPRGGIDKVCQMIAFVRGADPVMIVERGEAVQAVVNRAARRLGYCIGRRIHRKRIAGTPEHRDTIRAA